MGLRCWDLKRKKKDMEEGPSEAIDCVIKVGEKEVIS